MHTQCEIIWNLKIEPLHLEYRIEAGIEGIRTQAGQPIYTVVLFIALGCWSAPKLKILVPLLVEKILLFKALCLRGWNSDS